MRIHIEREARQLVGGHGPAAHDLNHARDRLFGCGVLFDRREAEFGVVGSIDQLRTHQRVVGREVEVEVVVTGVEEGPTPMITGDGFLSVDGTPIYEVQAFGMRLVV